MHLPAPTSHSFRLPSLLPDKTFFPIPRMATEVTALLWPVSVLGLTPELEEKIRTVASEEAVSTTCGFNVDRQLLSYRSVMC